MRNPVRAKYLIEGLTRFLLNDYQAQFIFMIQSPVIG